MSYSDWKRQALDVAGVVGEDLDPAVLGDDDGVGVPETAEARLVEAGLDREHHPCLERRVVAAFARTITEVRGDDPQSRLGKPMAMLLFGMINWMFTWLRPDGSLTHEQMAPLVADLFFGGLAAVRKPRGGGSHRPVGAGIGRPGAATSGQSVRLALTITRKSPPNCYF